MSKTRTEKLYLLGMFSFAYGGVKKYRFTFVLLPNLIGNYRDEEGIKQRILLFVMHLRTTRKILLQWITGPDHWTEEELDQGLEELIQEQKITEINDGENDPFYVPVVHV